MQTVDQLNYDIVIVGAGPTGLSLCAKLKQLGISSLILDRLPEGANTSRAIAIHARTLEVLESLNVTSELIKEGIIVNMFRVRDRDRILASISFKDLNTEYPFVLICPQVRTEAILLHRLESLGEKVQRPCEVVTISNGENNIQVQFKEDDKLKIVHAKWLIGCDGMHSIVREQSAIAFIGSDYEEAFVLADVEMDWPLDREEVNLFFSQQGLVMVAPLPDNLFRIVATVKQASAKPLISDFQQILEERGPEIGTIKIRQIKWASQFHIQHRIASVMRKGRIILAGDAAHVHSPAGGQGMNTGIQDAIALAEALKDFFLNGGETALNQWEENRLKIAHSVVKLTDQLTKIATLSSTGMQVFRHVIISIIGHIPYMQHALAKKLSELDNR